MYLKKNDLRDALNALSLLEKRYFQQYLKSLHQGSIPMYLRLFENITEQKSDFLEWPAEASPQVMTIAKKRLYQHLMQCLRKYHQKKSIQIIIQNMLCEIEILYDLGLPDQSAVLLKKAHAKALVYEKYGLLLQTLEWERKLNIILDTPSRNTDVIAEEERMVLREFSQIIELENIYGKVKEMKKQYGYVKGEAKRELETITVKNPYLTKQYKASSQRGKYYYHFIHVLYYWMTFDHKSAYSHSKKLLEPAMQNVLPNEYLDGVLEHITSCVCLGYFKEALTNLSVASAFVARFKFDQSKSFLIKMFYYEVCYKLIIYNYMGAHAKLRETIAEAEEKLEIYDKLISLEMKQVISGNLRNAYIGIANFKKAESLTEVMLQKESKLVRGDVYNDLFLFRIFMLLHSGAYTVIPFVALSALRHYRQGKRDEHHLEVELKIITVLLKEHDFNHVKIKIAILEKIKNILSKHITLLKGLNDFQEYYSFYIIWTESMLRQSPFCTVAADWYAQRRRKAQS